MAYHEQKQKHTPDKVTSEDVMHWLGSDHDTSELAQVVADLVNGEYPVKLAKQEITDLRD